MIILYSAQRIKRKGFVPVLIDSVPSSHLSCMYNSCYRTPVTPYDVMPCLLLSKHSPDQKKKRKTKTGAWYVQHIRNTTFFPTASYGSKFGTPCLSAKCPTYLMQNPFVMSHTSMQHGRPKPLPTKGVSLPVL